MRIVCAMQYKNGAEFHGFEYQKQLIQMEIYTSINPVRLHNRRCSISENRNSTLIKMYFLRLIKYPGFSKKKANSDSESEPQEQKMKLRNSVKLEVEQVPKKMVKVEVKPVNPKFEPHPKINIAKGEIAVNEFQEQQERNFDDLYNFGTNYQNNDAQSDSDSQQQYKQQPQQFTSSARFLKADSQVQKNNDSYNINNQFFSQISNGKFFDSMNPSQIPKNNMMTPGVQFIVPPQNFLQNPSPMILSLKDIVVMDEEINELNEVPNEGFKKYTK